MRSLIRKLQNLLFSFNLVSAGPQPQSVGGKKAAVRGAASKAQERRASGQISQVRSWKAASVNPGRGACEASRVLAGKRFLLNEIPHLPLTACDAARCDCKYAHHNDRRNPEHERRQPETALQTQLHGQSPQGKCRRRRRGRRRTD
jgi:hypothetical protein